jgi:ParB family chromosome partitioning protein
MIHELKCWIDPFWEVRRGRKTFEFRRDDRRFEEGDRLVLREWGEGCGYTGEAIEVEVTYILRGPSFGIPVGFAVMSIKKVSP